MQSKKQHIKVFEHESISLNQEFNEGKDKVVFDENKYKAFQKYYGNGSKVPYFTLINKGIKFNEYVGVIQIGNTVVEVLPKADKGSDNGDKDKWQKILIGILRAVGTFDMKSTSQASLKIKPNSILDLYFELFLNEVEYLLHSGLIKKYRKTEGNLNALKGSLKFNKHIQQNLVHQERFYVNHSVYDTQHLLHYILFKTINVIKTLNTSNALMSKVGSLLLNFPEMPDIKVTEATFGKIVYNRKSEHYKQAINIAKMILLHYHPDLQGGRNHVIALMFDMNVLWEKFVYVSLRKQLPDYTIRNQVTTPFWKPTSGNTSYIKPDIVINNGDGKCVVLDTKWKNLNGNNPSPDDLRQMYAYCKLFKAEKVALVYPGINHNVNGYFIEDHKECSVLSISLPELLNNKININDLHAEIENKIVKWISQ
jgi:5-methylcytosine-specific restriction enzyme subunit McrC